MSFPLYLTSLIVHKDTLVHNYNVKLLLNFYFLTRSCCLYWWRGFLNLVQCTKQLENPGQNSTEEHLQWIWPFPLGSQNTNRKRRSKRREITVWKFVYRLRNQLHQIQNSNKSHKSNKCNKSNKVTSLTRLTNLTSLTRLTNLTSVTRLTNLTSPTRLTNLQI